MKPLKLTYDIIAESDNRFVGWLNEVDGVIAQGESHQEVRDELLKILRIKWDLERQDKAAKPRHENYHATTEEFNLQIA